MVDLEKPMHFTKEQSEWIKQYVIVKKQEARAEAIEEYLTYVREHADRYSYHKPNEGFSLAELIMLEIDFEREQK